MNNSIFSTKKLFFGIFILLLIAVPITVYFVNQTALKDSRSHANASTDAAQLTKDLLSNQGNDTEKISTAVARKNKMKKLAKTPEEFLLNVIPEELRLATPKLAQEEIEKKVEIEGVLFEDINEEDESKEKQPNSAILQTIDSDGNSTNTYQVYLREEMSKEYSGKVKVKGYLIDNILVPITIENSSNVLGLATTGNIKIAVIMVNFKNDDSDIINNFSQEQLNQIYFADPTNSVAKYISNASFGKLLIKGDISDVYGWLDLPGYTRDQVCDIYEKNPDNKGFSLAIKDLARIEATKRGKNFDDYDLFAFIFPTIPTVPKNSDGTNCSWNAITKGIPGDTIVSPVHFLNGDYDGVNDVDHGNLDSISAKKFYSGIIAHEVGHSLGLSHAHGMLCGTKQIAAYSNCSIYNYGDRFDLIGGAWDYHPHTNAKNKILEGWIPTTNMKTVTTDGTYTLYSSSKPRTDQTQLIKIDRPVDSGNYYLEYRSQNNGDGGMPDYIYNGALLRLSDADLPPMQNENGGTQDEWRIKQTYLIDVNKTDSSGRGGLLNPSFKDNMIFDDSRNFITIKQLSHDVDSVRLAINFGTPPCNLNIPTLTVTEPSLSGNPGEKIRYSFTITNKNSTYCPNATYNLNGVFPSGWTGSFTKTSVYLSSGGSTTFSADITSPTSAIAADNPFSIFITAQSSTSISSKTTTEIRYNIIALTPTQNPTNTPTPTLKPSTTPTPKPTATPTLALTPTPTIKPIATIPPVTIPPESTTLHFSSVKLHGIGNGGENVNINATGNMNPLTLTRILNVEVINSNGTVIANLQGNINYQSSTGDFSGDVIIPSNVTPDNFYVIKVKADKYIKKQLDGIIYIKSGIANQASPVALTTGDTNLDGELTILDYILLIDCYSDLLPAKNCNDQSKKSQADLSDDGRVNQNDYNLFIRELSVKNGQ